MESPGKGAEFSHPRGADPTHPTRPALRGLYAITPEAFQGEALAAQSARLLAAGVRWLQYRDKSADPLRRVRDAAVLAALCREAGAALVVNDDPQLALEVAAAGVHLGEDDGDPAQVRRRLGPGRIIGVSCYDSRSRAEDALAAGADYVAFGAFFPSRSKQTGRRAGLGLLQWAREAGATAVAIGGIRIDNAAPLVAAGASMLAVIDAVWQAVDPAAAARAFADLFPSP